MLTEKPTVQTTNKSQTSYAMVAVKWPIDTLIGKKQSKGRQK